MDFVQLALNMRVICKMSALGSHYNLSSYTFPGSFVSLLLDEEQGSENAQLPVPATHTSPDNEEHNQKGGAVIFSAFLTIYVNA